jgi:hypothetical protein
VGNGRGPLPKHLPALISFESEATAIIDASMLLVPGLLQTADYTRALLVAAGVASQEIETMVAARLGRQAVLSRLRSLRYLAILDEAVLRRPVGGAQTMIEQVRHILRCGKRPNIEIRVVPIERGAHTGLDGSFTILEFVRGRTIVYLEHKRSSLFVDEPDDVVPFHAARDTLLETALGRGNSHEFLVLVAKDFSEG